MRAKVSVHGSFCARKVSVRKSFCARKFLCTKVSVHGSFCARKFLRLRYIFLSTMPTIFCKHVITSRINTRWSQLVVEVCKIKFNGGGG